jgi:hypothetical protein
VPKHRAALSPAAVYTIRRRLPRSPDLQTAYFVCRPACFSRCAPACFGARFSLGAVRDRPRLQGGMCWELGGGRVDCLHKPCQFAPRRSGLQGPRTAQACVPGLRHESASGPQRRREYPDSGTWHERTWGCAGPSEGLHAPPGQAQPDKFPGFGWESVHGAGWSTPKVRRFWTASAPAASTSPRDCRSNSSPCAT